MVLLIPDNKTDDEYKQWGAKIGMPSELGVHLKVGISYSDCPPDRHTSSQKVLWEFPALQKMIMSAVCWRVN